MNKENPEIKYYNKDFSSLREGLINFAKIYYPNSYSDFNEASPGMMFIDMAAYVGDVLSYYIDDAFKETQLLKAERTENVLQIAQSLGYKPNVTATANTALDVFMVVPKIGTGTDNKPDYRYALTINPGMEVASETYPDIIFRVDDYIDFSLSGSEYEKPEVSVYTVDGAGEPLEYLLKKQVKARSATKGTKTVEVPSSPEKYYKVLINRDDIIDIDSITDSEGNT